MESVRRSVLSLRSLVHSLIIRAISEVVLLTIGWSVSSGHTSRQLSALLDQPTGLSGYIGLASGAKSIINQGGLPKPSFTPCNNAAAIFRLWHGFKKMSQLSIETVLGKCCRAYGCHDYSPAAGKITTESRSEMKYQCLLTIGPNYGGLAVTSKAFLKEEISFWSGFRCIIFEINNLLVQFQRPRINKPPLEFMNGHRESGEKNRRGSGSGECKKCPQKIKKWAYHECWMTSLKLLSVYLYGTRWIHASLKATVCEE